METFNGLTAIPTPWFELAILFLLHMWLLVFISPYMTKGIGGNDEEDEY